MKKVFLLATIAGLVSFTSCKKENKDNVEPNKSEEVTPNPEATVKEEAVETMEVTVPAPPKFEDTKLQEWANNLQEEAASAVQSSLDRNQEALTDATTKMASLRQALQSFKDNAEFEKAKSYYDTISSSLQAQN